MAISGHNGNNETLIGRSSSIGLSFYDENIDEIKIDLTNEPIYLIVKRDFKISDNQFQYVNTSTLLLSSSFLPNSFNITSNNASIHIEVEPLNRTVGYLIVMKLGFMPVINSSHADYTSFKILCPSNEHF